jgi:hypothetical protein
MNQKYKKREREKPLKGFYVLQIVHAAAEAASAVSLHTVRMRQIEKAARANTFSAH